MMAATAENLFRLNKTFIDKNILHLYFQNITATLELNF